MLRFELKGERFGNNRPFPSYPLPVGETHFHMNCFARRLVLKTEGKGKLGNGLYATGCIEAL